MFKSGLAPPASRSSIFRSRATLVLSLLITFLAPALQAADRENLAPAAQATMASALDAQARGDRWQARQLCSRVVVAASPADAIDCTLLLADDFLAESEYAAGVAILQRALAGLAKESVDRPGARALVLQRLANFYLRLEYLGEAGDTLDQLEALLEQLDWPELHHLLPLYRARLALARQDYPNARDYRAQLRSQLQSRPGTAEPPVQLVPVALDSLRLALDLYQVDAIPAAEFQGEFTALNGRLRAVPKSQRQCSWLLSLANLGLSSGLPLQKPGDDPLLSLFEEAQELAPERVTDDEQTIRCRSQSLGGLARLMESRGEWNAALAYGRQANYFAQQIEARDLLYQWYWLNGRVLNRLGDRAAAIDNYQQAVDSLKGIRTQLVLQSRRGYPQLVGPLYYELVGLLLAESRDAGETLQQQYLMEARDVIESLKVAELEDYFQSECVVVEEHQELGQLGADSAVLYPILMPEQIELLLNLRGKMHRFTTPVPRVELAAEVQAFRQSLESYRSGADLMDRAQRLYSWLIEPMESTLRSAGITTLTVIPDGPLRTIPIAALHSGQEYVIQRYAVATSLGLTLTSPGRVTDAEIRVLANGLTQSVAGFPALPYVDSELESIDRLFPTTTNRNERFNLQRIQTEVAEGDFSVVHIATHGEFSSDHRESFLLAYDNKLTMDRLQYMINQRRYRQQPLDLLVLSACQTAAGDDRAALGLAGVALKAGARSALATLWFISDEATSTLITEFYTQLNNPQLSKAEALQQAQLKLIDDELLNHPSFWSPFLLIGNWL